MATHVHNYIHYPEQPEDTLDQLIREQNEALEEDEEDGDEDDDEEEEDDDAVVEYIPVVSSPRVSMVDPTVTNLGSVNAIEGNEVVDRRRAEQGDDTSPCNEKVGIEENWSEEEWNRSEIDGLFCPICMEAWTNGGDHQVCCLPCGHIYGLACIKKWLRQRRSSEKCPQCNRKCKLKDVRLLYASRIVVVENDLQKKVRKLEAKCASLERENANSCMKEAEGQKIEADLHLQVDQLTERINYLEGLLGDTQRRLSGSITGSGGCQGRSIPGYSLYPESGKRGCSSTFALQNEFKVEGARYFDVDTSSHILIIARRLSGTGTGGMHILTKISLMAPNERDDIQLPATTKAVKDLCISPHTRLTLLASLGRKISVLSTETNNTILSYDLPAAAWSCSWDTNSSHYAYAGLQNGMLLVFDIRQTQRPVESRAGLTCNPIHSLHCLSLDSATFSGVRTILTASSVGLCEWNFGNANERPFLVPGSENLGICISLACAPSSDEIVASFRPKFDMSDEVTASQYFLTPSAMGYSVLGSHVLYNRMGSQCYQMQGSRCATFDSIRLPRSAIIDGGNDVSLFAYGDEGKCELILEELPSLTVVQHLKPRKPPIRDVKYARVSNMELVSCLSEDTLQLFSPKRL